MYTPVYNSIWRNPESVGDVVASSWHKFIPLLYVAQNPWLTSIYRMTALLRLVSELPRGPDAIWGRQFFTYEITSPMDSILHCSFLISGILVFLAFWHYVRKARPSQLPLPPGPKGLPVVGNLFDIPTDKPWLVYDKWFQQYGVYSTCMSQIVPPWLSSRWYHPCQSPRTIDDNSWVHAKV